LVQSFVVKSVDGNSSETPASLSYTAEVSKPVVEKTSKPYSTVDETATNKESITEPVEEDVATQPIRAAKIHDFCFGIPYGGLVVSGGLLGFAFSRNLTSLSTGVLYGGGLLALSTLSLKIWREGKSSFPYILGQAGNLHLLSAGTVGDILLPRLFFISNSLHQVITGILLMISGY